MQETQRDFAIPLRAKMMMQRATSVPSCASHRALAAPSLGAVPALRPACSATKRSPTVATQAAVTVNGKTQQYVIKPDDVREVPVTGVQEMPEAQQAAIFFAIFGAIAAGTVAICTLTDMNWTQSPAAPFIFGITFGAAGLAHFREGVHEGFCSMMPTPGAWGFWNLPGSDSFHVNWTGVAEVAGSVGLLAAQVPQVREALPWLESASALGLFVLTVAVTPSNIFMATHNAPGPVPKEVPMVEPPGHFFRLSMQSVLLAALWGLAFGVDGI